MNKKKEILDLIVQTLSHDFEVLFNAAKTAHQASIDAENVPDNKYDTLSLEASYVAQGQANRAQEIKSALKSYRDLELMSFDDSSAVRLTALVTLEDEDGARRTVILGPCAGGLKVSLKGEEITVITPHSPLGRQLLGKRVGDAVEVAAAEATREYEVVEIL